MTLREVYNNSKKLLKNPDVDEINIRIILCEINHIKNMTEFYLSLDQEIEDLQRFQSIFARFLDGEPLQYILGKTLFFGSEFKVDKRVLIPRQETEEVVQYILNKKAQIFGHEKVDLIDVCCGSGCMGISVAKNCEISSLFLSDISKDSIDVTKDNLKLNNVVGKCYVSDGLDAIISDKIHVDILVSNPPYILNKNEVEKSTIKYEPELALFADENLSVYRKIISKLNLIKKEKLLAVFEIGYDLKDKLEAIVREYLPESKYEFVKDINGKERILSILVL